MRQRLVDTRIESLPAEHGGRRDRHRLRQGARGSNVRKRASRARMSQMGARESCRGRVHG